MSFEEALAKLEEVVDRLESGDLALEASLSAFEEGVRLSGRCAKKLDAAEQRVEILVREGGALTRRLFGSDAALQQDAAPADQQDAAPADQQDAAPADQQDAALADGEDAEDFDAVPG